MVDNGKPYGPMELDDLGVPLFLETPISCIQCILSTSTFHATDLNLVACHKPCKAEILGHGARD